MDKAVVIGIFVWLIAWLFDLLSIIAPSLSMLFLILKIIFVTLGVVSVGYQCLSFRPWL